MVEVLGTLPLVVAIPREINVYCDPHARMKELVEEVVEKVQLEVLNVSRMEREAILQSLYRIVWELKTHEIIENTFIMRKLKERLDELDIYDQMVCNCHEDSKLFQIIELVESLYNSHGNSARQFYWSRLQEAVYMFMEEFLPHMEEEETTFQPLLSQYFQYEELKQLKETVLLEHEVWKRRVEAEKNLEASSLGWDMPIGRGLESHLSQSDGKALSTLDDGPLLPHLPDEILINIFSYLPPNQLMAAGRTCRRWNRVSKSSQLWHQLHLARWHEGDWAFRSEDELYEPDPEKQRRFLVEDSGSSVKFYDQFLNFLPAICQGVKKISVAGSFSISDEAMLQLLKCCENNLEELDASYAMLSERAFRGLQLGRLRRLDLAGNTSLTDSALRNLLSSSPRLSWLSLSGCIHLTDRGLAVLQASGRLEYVDLSGCFNLTGDGLVRLSASCPQLEPENLAYCSYIENGPYQEEANGCQNMGSEIRSCCSRY